MIESKQLVNFPDAQDLMVNMMPVIMGDEESIPTHLRDYVSMMHSCNAFEPGKTVYLTVNESVVQEGRCQRSPGIHTDATSSSDWGSGTWGSSHAMQMFGGPRFGGDKPVEPRFGGPVKFGGGIYLASTDGATRAWNTESSDVNHLGAMAEPNMDAIYTQANRLYHMCDRTPHEALPAQIDHYRQFFRLVGPDVSVWWAKHSTANPLGVQPDCKILTHSKFEA